VPKKEGPFYACEENCRKADEKETECPNFDRDAADKLSLSLILKTDPFVPVTEQSFFE
jgi:hypothetical protein